MGSDPNVGPNAPTPEQHVYTIIAYKSNSGDYGEYYDSDLQIEFVHSLPEAIEVSAKWLDWKGTGNYEGGYDTTLLVDGRDIVDTDDEVDRISYKVRSAAYDIIKQRRIAAEAAAKKRAEEDKIAAKKAKEEWRKTQEMKKEFDEHETFLRLKAKYEPTPELTKDAGNANEGPEQG